MQVIIELTLVDLTRDVRDDNKDGTTNISLLLADVLDYVTCTTAEAFFLLSPSSTATTTAAAVSPRSTTNSNDNKEIETEIETEKRISEHLPLETTSDTVVGIASGYETAGQQPQQQPQPQPQPQPQKCTAERIQQQIIRFLKIPDKYVSFTSILLKSQAFHLAHNTIMNNTKHTITTTKMLPLPLVEIPRTPYNKPYIPTKRPPSHPYQDQYYHSQEDEEEEEEEEANMYPLSISHQFPFVGMARLVTVIDHDDCHDDDDIPTTSTSTSTSTLIVQAEDRRSSDSNNRQPLVGLDIVTFDTYNPKLYGSLSEFLQAFQTSFTPWEWDCIQSCDDDHNNKVMLREFYLRWAIKEAYTKALGVGMFLPFDSFETRLDFTTKTSANGTPNKEEKEQQQGIFSWMCRQHLWLSGKKSGNTDGDENDNDNRNQSVFLPGSVVVYPKDSASITPETATVTKMTSEAACLFFFKPLWEQDICRSQRSLENARGCACVCIILRPSLSSSLAPNEICNMNNNNKTHHRKTTKNKDAGISVTAKWQSLKDLISWHRR